MGSTAWTEGTCRGSSVNEVIQTCKRKSVELTSEEEILGWEVKKTWAHFLTWLMFKECQWSHIVKTGTRQLSQQLRPDEGVQEAWSHCSRLHKTTRVIAMRWWIAIGQCQRKISNTPRQLRMLQLHVPPDPTSHKAEDVFPAGTLP